MLHIERLTADHAAAVLAFERENRAFFVTSLPDRGDDYFSDFERRHAALLAEQEQGGCHFHVLVDDRGAVVGRFNLVDVADGAAELGFRVAQHVTGRGVASRAVSRICAIAAHEYGLRALYASTTVDNVGSRAVLSRAGFRCVGEVQLAGRPGLEFRCELPAAVP